MCAQYKMDSQKNIHSVERFFLLFCFVYFFLSHSEDDDDCTYHWIPLADYLQN